MARSSVQANALQPLMQSERVLLRPILGKGARVDPVTENEIHLGNRVVGRRFQSEK